MDILRHLTLKIQIKIKTKFTSFFIDDEKLLEKYKTIKTKTEDLKNIKLNALFVYDDKYIKTNNNFRGLNFPEDNMECESFTVISITSLLVYENKFYLQIYLDN